MANHLKHKDITEKIIGACFEVDKFLGNACLPVRQGMMKSVKSFNPCKSVMQTIYDIVRAHGGVPPDIYREAIGMRLVTEVGRVVFSSDK